MFPNKPPVVVADEPKSPPVVCGLAPNKLDPVFVVVVPNKEPIHNIDLTNLAAELLHLALNKKNRVHVHWGTLLLNELTGNIVTILLMSSKLVI